MAATSNYHDRVLVTQCCADCNQGRRACQCPEACQLPEPDEQSRRLRAIFWRLYLAALIVAVGYGVSLLLPLVRA